MKEVGGDRSLYWSKPVYLSLNLTNPVLRPGEARSDYRKLDRGVLISLSLGQLLYEEGYRKEGK